VKCGQKTSLYTISPVSFFLNTGDFTSIPKYFQFSNKLSNPDVSRDVFVDVIMKHFSVIGVSGISNKRPKAPAYVFMREVESTWQGLRSVLWNSLHLSIVGYPFVNPGPIGGVLDYKNDTEMDAELFIRWWQLATFLPVVHFHTPPSTLPFDKISGVSKKLSEVRKGVSPLLEELSTVAMQSSLPIVRPLWMFNSRDPASYVVNDQFLLGDKVMVAPVLSQGQTTRDVYLPKMVREDGTEDADVYWKNQNDGRFYHGGEWLRDVKVALDEVLYFERQEDNPFAAQTNDN